MLRSDIMFKRVITTIIALASTFATADEPRLFVGVNIGSSFMAVSPPEPENSSALSPLTTLLGGSATTTDRDGVVVANTSYSNQALLETSNTFDNYLLIMPTLGMTFPVTNRIQLEGYARLDAVEKDFTVQSHSSTDKIIAKISREIGIGGALMVRISKQYAIGPVAEAVVLTNETPLYSASSEKDYVVYEFGVQSVYAFHEYFSLGLSCTASLDQNFVVKDTIGSNDLTLDYTVAKAQISLRLTPI